MRFFVDNHPTYSTAPFRNKEKKQSNSKAKNWNSKDQVRGFAYFFLFKNFDYSAQQEIYGFGTDHMHYWKMATDCYTLVYDQGKLSWFKRSWSDAKGPSIPLKLDDMGWSQKNLYNKGHPWIRKES